MNPKIYLSNKEGFTLIEIMASLVIIGVLALVGRYQNNVCHEANVDKLNYCGNPEGSGLR